MRRYLSEDFAEFISKTDYRDLQEEVIRQAKRRLLDFLGVALAGCRVGLAPLTRTLISAIGGSEEAAIIGNGRKVPALQAGLINEVIGHTLDIDDYHRFPRSTY